MEDEKAERMKKVGQEGKKRARTSGRSLTDGSKAFYCKDCEDLKTSTHGEEPVEEMTDSR